jgi:hypothetical protein
MISGIATLPFVNLVVVGQGLGSAPGVLLLLPTQPPKFLSALMLVSVL